MVYTAGASIFNRLGHLSILCAGPYGHGQVHDLSQFFSRGSVSGREGKPVQDHGIIASQIGYGDIPAEFAFVLRLLEAPGNGLECALPETREVVLDGSVFDGAVGSSEDQQTPARRAVRREGVDSILQHGMNRISGCPGAREGTDGGVAVGSHVEVHSLVEECFLVAVGGVEACLSDAQTRTQIGHRGGLIAQLPEEPHRSTEPFFAVELPGSSARTLGRCRIFRLIDLFLCNRLARHLIIIDRAVHISRRNSSEDGESHVNGKRSCH